MDIIIDAKGLSCPQPVLLTIDKIKDMQKGKILVRVDTDTSRENVSRAAKSQGWDVADIQKDETGYRLIIKKE